MIVIADRDAVLRELHASLDRRRRPEDVARLILDGFADLYSPAERAAVRQAAAGASSKNWGYSSMSDDFARPSGLEAQLRVAAELFAAVPPLAAESGGDPEAVGDYLATAGRTISKRVGRSDFLADRLNRAARATAGVELTKRQYNKRFRLLARMEAKRARLVRGLRKRFFTLVGKSRLAATVPWDRFAADAATACFLAYYTARCHLRSEFTVTGQQRPYDTVADALFAAVRRSPAADWWAVAHAYPDREVLARLSDDQKGRLLGTWFGILEEVAGLLREVWAASAINRQTMIVRRGNDSSTWNGTAGAWNAAREAWVSLLHALGADEVLDACCPGKVLKLVAADVAAWHRAVGGGLDPDTAVWSELPLPWEALAGEADCTRATVERVCRRHGVDPVVRGWTAPRPKQVAAFRPTPELVHGVTVGHPGLALILRKAGVFSGKGVKWLVE